MTFGRPKGWGLATVRPVILVMAIAAVTVLGRPRPSTGEEIITGEVIIEATALQPQVLMTEAEHKVLFVNRSGKMVHIQFLMPKTEEPQHHIIQVPDQIWAVFHLAGRHPYVVHFGDPKIPNLEGAIEVVKDPYGRPDPLMCGWITVQGVCIER